MMIISILIDIMIIAVIESLVMLHLWLYAYMLGNADNREKEKLKEKINKEK